MTAMCQSKSCQLQRNSVGTRGKENPACIPPGYTPRHLLIIVDLSVNRFACVQRSICTSCLIPSHASVGEMYEGKMSRGKCPFPERSMSVPLCIGVINRSPRRSTSCITLTTVERVVDECTEFITHWSLWRKKLCGLNKKLVAMATSLERSQPNFTAIICSHKATNSENFTKIGCVISEIN